MKTEASSGSDVRELGPGLQKEVSDVGTPRTPFGVARATASYSEACVGTGWGRGRTTAPGSTRFPELHPAASCGAASSSRDVLWPQGPGCCFAVGCGPRGCGLSRAVPFSLQIACPFATFTQRESRVFLRGRVCGAFLRERGGAETRESGPSPGALSLAELTLSRASSLDLLCSGLACGCS